MLPCWSTAGDRVGLSLRHPGVRRREGQQDTGMELQKDSAWILGRKEEGQRETRKGETGFRGYPQALHPAPVQIRVRVVGVRGGTCGEKHVGQNVPPSFLT